jgi:peptidyl-prolyl cis-trans isomerase C
MIMRPAIFLGSAVAVFTVCIAPVHAAGPSPETVVATVGSEPIRAGEVQRLLTKATRGRKVAAEALPYAKAQVLEEIIARRLVLAYAERTGGMPNEAAIEKARVKWKTQLSAQHKTLAEYLKAQGMTEADFQRQLVWGLVWEKYTAKYLTPTRLDAYFRDHHRELDGTELAVSHILLRSSPGQPIKDLVKRAEAVRREIADGKLSFAEAAKKYSDGPSRADGGKLGFIGRHGPMDEAFSRAAFALEPGQISPAVKTPFGMHLIRCNEAKPGKKQLADVRKEVEAALERELLDKLATLQREQTPVKYTDHWPHFKPGTRELEKP